jgi:hypothetical protein
MVKRMSNHISKKNPHRIVDSLWTSKLRYGLQLCTEVRLTEEQPKSQLVTMVQRAQNKMLRVLDRARIVDQKSTKSLLEEQNMLSVNQMASQIKLTEMLKASNDPHYPIKMKMRDTQVEGMETISSTCGDLTEIGGSKSAKKSFTIDAAKVWNKASEKQKQQKHWQWKKRQSKRIAKLYPFKHVKKQ